MIKKFTAPKPIYSKNSSKAVLLMHAYSGSPNDVRMLARFLEQSNYSVYTPMFSGHGTDNPEDILNEDPEKWWNQTKEAIQFLKEEGFKEIAIFGLSMGGIFATMALELNDPAIIGGGAFCSPILPIKNNVPENFYKYAEYILTNFSALSEDEKQEILQQVPESVEKQMTHIHELSQLVYTNLSKIEKPLFLAQAAQDEMIQANSVFQTLQELKKQKVTFQWYPKSGHVITVGPERKEFEKDVLSFIERLSWSEV